MMAGQKGRPQMRTSFLISAENMPGNARGRPETPGDVRKRRGTSGNARQEASAGSSFCGISDRGQEEENGWQY